VRLKLELARLGRFPRRLYVENLCHPADSNWRGDRAGYHFVRARASRCGGAQPSRQTNAFKKVLGNRVACFCSIANVITTRTEQQMNFRIVGLPAEEFTHLFRLSDADLAAAGCVRRMADGNYPCRVSLLDSQPGEQLLLVNYEHHSVHSPYRMRFAIFVREGDRTYDRVNEVPEQLRKRMLAVRSFDCRGMMVDHRLVDGQGVEAVIETLLKPSDVDYLHIHFASAGCYAAKVVRA
jgi:hypothetical protein